MSNTSLQRAKDAKNDEYYTQLEDIDAEVSIYRDHFANKSIYCPCDGTASNFWRHFCDHFEDLKLKSVAQSSYNKDGCGDIEVLIDGYLSDDGSSVSRYMKEHADIVVTNPPFPRFRDFMAVVLESKKEFLVVANLLAVTYRDIFP